MPRSALWAATHPCYAFPGYRCACGVKSANIKGHNGHVREKHADDEKFCESVLSWREYDKMFPGNIACSDCGHPNTVRKALKAGRCVNCYPTWRTRKKQRRSLFGPHSWGLKSVRASGGAGR